MSPFSLETLVIVIGRQVVASNTVECQPSVDPSPEELSEVPRRSFGQLDRPLRYTAVVSDTTKLVLRSENE